MTLERDPSLTDPATSDRPARIAGQVQQPALRRRRGRQHRAGFQVDLVEPLAAGTVSLTGGYRFEVVEGARLFAGVGRVLQSGGVFCLYGPFNYGGQYTSDSNARFDQWLAQQNPQSAIRHFESVHELAGAAGFDLQSDNTMPANNRLLVWQRLTS